MRAMPTRKKGHGPALGVVMSTPSSIGKLGNRGLVRLKLRNSVTVARSWHALKRKDVQVVLR